MGLFKRGKFYWYEFELNKTRHRASTKCTNQKDARDVENAARLALVKGEVGIVKRKPLPTLGHAMEGFLDWSKVEHKEHPETTARYRYSSLPLLKYFGTSTIVDQISPDKAEAYKRHRSRQRSERTKRILRPATVNRELACLRAMFNHTTKTHSGLLNPITKQTGVRLLREENEQDRVISFVEEEKYLACADPLLRDIALLILQTGMRPDEIYSLEGKYVNIAEGHLRVIRSKTKAGRRRVELNEVSTQILQARKDQYGEGYLFPHRWDKEKQKTSSQSAHERALRESKVAPFRLYDLRHTWATRAAEAGIDLVTLAAMMGHSRIQMVLRYAHPTQSHQTSAMEKVSAHARATRAKQLAAARLSEERAAGEQKIIMIRKNA